MVLHIVVHLKLCLNNLYTDQKELKCKLRRLYICHDRLILMLDVRVKWLDFEVMGVQQIMGISDFKTG